MYLLDTNILMSAEDLEKMVADFTPGESSLQNCPPPARSSSSFPPVSLKRKKVGEKLEALPQSKPFISLETLEELDKLKTAPEAKGYRARKAVKYIESHWDSFTFVRREKKYYRNLNRNETSMDDIIISYIHDKVLPPSVTLVTNDLSMRLKAKALSIPSIGYYQNAERRVGVYEIEMDNEEFTKFSVDRKPPVELNKGEYLIVKTKEFEPKTRVILKFNSDDDWDVLDMKAGIKNYLFEIKAKDDFQRCAIDSLMNDDLTVLTGSAGTGKTLLSIGYALSQLKEGSKIHVFVNPVKTRGSEELGFYPGSRDEKLLQNFIGDILRGKLGDATEVERLLSQGILNIYPFSDIRGIEIAADDIMYITEAQNLSVDLIKLAIQRPAEGAKIIIEGDPYTQVDKGCFEGEQNGLRRLIKVFSGVEGFSHVQLPIIYRSKIADKAELL